VRWAGAWILVFLSECTLGWELECRCGVAVSVIRTWDVGGIANWKLCSKSGTTRMDCRIASGEFYIFIGASYGADWVADWLELPVAGAAHVAASDVHSTDGWDFTHAIIFPLISLVTEFLRLVGKWKKLHVG
jgi:hypothetical protein